MKRLPILFLLAFFFQTAHAQKKTEEIRHLLRERVEVEQTNQSVVVAVINDQGASFTSYGKTNDSAGAKNSDENTIFEIGSVTKVFTGTLLAEAVRRGEVKLDDPISKYLPANVKSPTRGGKQITLLDLATHTSGLPRLPGNFTIKNSQNPYADYTVEQMYDFLSKYELPRGIGATYEYSNLGAGLLGHILSLRAKTSYEDLVKTRILKPLGMNDTTITLSAAQKSQMAQGFDASGEPTSNWDLPTLGGAGALRSTAKDMAKFVAANAGLTKTELSEDFGAAHKPLRDAGKDRKIGLAWQIMARPGGEIIWHNGGTGGFRSFVGFDKAQKRGVVVLTNTAESVDDIGLHLLDAQLPLKKAEIVFPVSEKILEEYTGEYELAPNFIFTVTRRGDRLFAQLTGQPRAHVYAESENKFKYRGVEAALKFNRSADGKIESLTLIQGGERIAKKIK